MKRYIIVVLLVLLGLNSLGFAAMNRQIWENTNLGGAFQAWHADKRPGMPLDPLPDIEDVLEESWWGDRADNYTANLWGWVTIPTTGEYQWGVHSDNASFLYVSKDDSMDNLEVVASGANWQSVGGWLTDLGGENTISAPMPYTKGQVLAVYGIMTEGGGGDNLGIGWILPGQTEVTYISDYVTNLQPASAKASKLSPAHNAQDLSRDTQLTWAPGELANSYTLYFGIDLGEVSDGTGDVLVVEGLIDSFNPGRLEFGTTYYWRLDGVTGNAVSTGFVAQFTVEPEALVVTKGISVTSSSHKNDSLAGNTINGSGLNGNAHATALNTSWLSDDDPNAWIQYDFDKAYVLHTVHIWNSNSDLESLVGYGIQDMLIEYSVDGQNWNELMRTVLPQAPGNATYTGQEIMLDIMASSVRMTALSNWSTMGFANAGLAEVQFSMLPVWARESMPANKEVTDNIDVTLQWRAGRLADQHEVRFSDDKQAMAEGLVAAQTTTETSLDVGPLMLGSTYYWQVTEVNSADPTLSFTSDLTSFRTPEILAVDNFENYNDDFENHNRIFQVWIDGAGYTYPEPGVQGNGSGSLVGTSSAPWVEKTIVNSGRQSMPIMYMNSTAATSIAVRTFDPVQNWSAGAPESLILHYHGDENNGAQPIYVIIMDVAGKEKVFQTEATDATQVDVWTPLVMPLADMAIAGLDLSGIKSMTIGVGNSNASQGDGSQGTIYVDDIILTKPYPPTSTTTYEAESGVVAGGAIINTDVMASAGQAVGSFHLAGSSLELKDIDGGKGGLATLDILYASGQGSGASLALQVNGVDYGMVTFSMTGGWHDYTGVVQLTIVLNAGTDNTIKLLGQGSGVNIDALVIDPEIAFVQTVYEAEEGVVANGAVISSDVAASAGKAVGSLHLADSSLEIDHIDGGSGGTAVLHIIYALGGSASVNLKVNDVSSGLVHFSDTGGWHAYTGEVLVPISLKPGTGNTITFESNGSGVNLDLIVVDTGV